MGLRGFWGFRGLAVLGLGFWSLGFRVLECVSWPAMGEFLANRGNLSRGPYVDLRSRSGISRAKDPELVATMQNIDVDVMCVATAMHAKCPPCTLCYRFRV